MTKAKTPLLSFDAHGSMGDAVTFQKRSRTNLVRKKPIPKQPDTLAQLYQRWDYHDQAYRWHALTASQKLIYETNARPYHMTGFAYWMSVQLTTLPDLIGRWRLDDRPSSSVIDSSKQDNNGTRYGASYVPGIINGCLAFDGINDRVVIPDAPILHLGTNPFEIELWLHTLSSLPTFATLLSKGTGVPMSTWAIHLLTNGRLRIYSGGTIRQTGPIFLDNAWHFCSFIRDDNDCYIFVDTILRASAANVFVGRDFTDTTNLVIGARNDPSDKYWPERIDNVVIYNRILDATERQAHYGRGYPS